MKYIGIYTVFSLIVATLYLCTIYFDVSPKLVWSRIFSYNNPFVIFSAVSFFMAFRSLSLKNKIINWFASSSLAIYLLHCNNEIGFILWDFIAILQSSIPNKVLLAIAILLVALVVMIACILVDKARMLITNPIEILLLKFDFGRIVSRLVFTIEKFIDKCAFSEK